MLTLEDLFGAGYDLNNYFEVSCLRCGALVIAGDVHLDWHNNHNI